MEYPEEILDDDWEDDGTMPNNVDTLRQAVVGSRIVSVEKGVEVPGSSIWNGPETATVITLDNGKRVRLVNTSDCCAFTELEAFLLNPESVEIESDCDITIAEIVR